VVDQIAPWIVQPAGAGDERDDPTHFELVGMDHPTADEQCRYDLKMTAKAAVCGGSGFLDSGIS
jgi:hypothetical protein